jgi:hypothetical protein
MPWKATPFKSELGDFPNGRHDDCIDAVAGAIHALSPQSYRNGWATGVEQERRQDHGRTDLDQCPLNDLPQ